MENDKFYVWSIEHNAWWKANHRGYTKNREEAGVYSYGVACAIVEGANAFNENKPNEAMIKI